MDKKSEFLTFFGIKSMESILLEGIVVKKLVVEVLMAMFFQVRVTKNYQDSFVGSANAVFVSLMVEYNHILSVFSKSFSPLAKSVPVLTKNVIGSCFFVILVKRARRGCMESFYFFFFATTVLSNRSWRNSNYFTRLLSSASFLMYATSMYQI